MYRLMALLRNGISVVAAEAETLDEIDMCSTHLENAMWDPTVAKIVYRNRLRTVAAKEVVATWVEEFAEGDDE